MQRTQVECCLSHPIRQRRTIELNALAGVNLRLPIERPVIGIPRHQNLGDGGFGRQSVLNHRFGVGACMTRLRKHGRRIWDAGS